MKYPLKVYLILGLKMSCSEWPKQHFTNKCKDKKFHEDFHLPLTGWIFRAKKASPLIDVQLIFLVI